MTTFRRVPVQNPAVLAIALVGDDGSTIQSDLDCKVGSPLWDQYQVWLASGNSLDSPVVIDSLPVLRQRLFGQVDAIVAALYDPLTRFQVEYDERIIAANAFVANEYQGDPGIWITSFATAAQLDNNTAADRIIAQNTALRAALAQIGALRMRKYEILNCPGDAVAVQNTYDDIVSKIKVIASQMS
jgi:hypothetical protein